MQIPLENIILKIKKETSMSEDEIHTKIKSKMEELAGLVSEEGAAHILARELNINLVSDEPEELKIIDIKPYMRNLIVVAKVMRVFDTINFERNSNPGKVKSLIIADETARLRVSFWHSAAEKIDDIKEGDIIKLEKASSRDNNGNVEVSTSFPDSIFINPEGIEITEVAAPSFNDPKIMKIAEISDDKYVSVVGAIVQAFKPNFYYSCPECKKRLNDGKCNEHGEVVPILSYVSNVFLDDATGVLRTVFFNDQVEKLFGLSNKDFVELKDNSEELDKLKEKVLGKLIKVSGSIRYSSFSGQNELVANKLDLEVDISKELNNFKK